MSRYNKLPFERGRSAFQNQATSDWDITSLAHLEGQKVYLPNIDPTNPEVRRNGTDVVAVVVRNDSGGLLVPGTARTGLGWKKNRNANSIFFLELLARPASPEYGISVLRVLLSPVMRRDESIL